MVIVLPNPGVLLKHAKRLWLKPALVLVSSWCLDHMYHVQQNGAEFLFIHLKPNLVVVTLALKLRQSLSTPIDKEGKKLDAAGHKFYSTGTLGIKGIFYITCMCFYTYALWELMSEVLDTVLEHKCFKERFLQKEGMLLGKQLNSPKHILDLFADILTSAV